MGNMIKEAIEQAKIEKIKNPISTNYLNQGPIKNEKGNFKYIKIIDIRKNENFGGLYMFLRRPSPLSLRVRSKIAELYLLSKKDIFSISKLYSFGINNFGKLGVRIP